MDEQKSWALFKRVVFRERNYEPTAGLVEIGKGIVGKCKGVPLAIKTIGGLLLSKNYFSQNLEQEWVKFRDIELAKVDLPKPN